MPNIHRFKNVFFTQRLSNKPFLIWLLTTPPHAKYVDTLPCNLSYVRINMSNQYIKHYHFVISSHWFPVPVWSAVKSYLTSRCNQNLFNRWRCVTSDMRRHKNTYLLTNFKCINSTLTSMNYVTSQSAANSQRCKLSENTIRDAVLTCARKLT